MLDVRVSHIKLPFQFSSVQFSVCLGVSAWSVLLNSYQVALNLAEKRVRSLLKKKSQLQQAMTQKSTKDKTTEGMFEEALAAVCHSLSSCLKRPWQRYVIHFHRLCTHPHSFLFPLTSATRLGASLLRQSLTQPLRVCATCFLLPPDNRKSAPLFDLI